MTHPNNKPADKDSLARFESVLHAYKSRPGSDAEPPADLDARILAMAALPVRKSLVEALGAETPNKVAALPRRRRALTWISWAAGAGALILSGGVLRIMLHENPNPQSAKTEELAQPKNSKVDTQVETQVGARMGANVTGKSEESAALPEVADAASTAVAPASAPMPVTQAQVQPFALEPLPELTADFAAKAPPPSLASSAPSSAPAIAAKEFAASPPVLSEPVEALDDVQVTGSRIARAAQDAAQAMPALELTVEAPAEPAAEVPETGSQAGDLIDSAPYAAKMSPSFDSAPAVPETQNRADKSNAVSESDDAEMMNSPPMPSARSAEALGQSAPESIPEVKSYRREAAKKALDPEALQRAFAKLRELQREGKLAALKLEIRQFRVNFPRDTEIPADLQAVFDANPEVRN